MLIGITRVRNEGLIIADTLAHYGAICDQILLYDDCSEDDTAEQAEAAGVTVIRGDYWRTDRPSEESRHRTMLMHQAQDMGADWVLCFDADERLDGTLPDLSANGGGYKFRLFDGYMTERYQTPYTGGELSRLRRMWGPEYRDITMLFRPETADFPRPDMRAPRIRGYVERAQGLAVKHFGKCLSVEHWEETCDYYSRHWPERYAQKWSNRKGKAIHTESDFGRPLHSWSTVQAHGVPM